MTSVLVEPAIYNGLADLTALTDLVGTNIFKNGKLEKGDLSGSGEAAVVIRVSGGDNPTGNSLGLPRVNIMIYADHTRVGGKISYKDAGDRMWTIFHIIDNYLHCPNTERREIDGLAFTGSLRGVEPQILTDKEAGLEYLWTAYDMVTIY